MTAESIQKGCIADDGATGGRANDDREYGIKRRGASEKALLAEPNDCNQRNINERCPRTRLPNAKVLRFGRKAERRFRNLRERFHCCSNRLLAVL